MLTPHEDQLAVLLGGDAPDLMELPWDAPSGGRGGASVAPQSLDEIANALALRVVGTAPAWIEQVGAFGPGTEHPSGAELSVGFAALFPLGTTLPVGGRARWMDVDDAPALISRQQEIIRSAVSAVRDRMDLSPVAFRLLPVSFTLSELQQTYELLLGKRLHKASFRRALQAAWLVEPTDEWRSEGRGRPAQLYRYAPKKRRKGRRGVRFDLLTP